VLIINTANLICSGYKVFSVCAGNILTVNDYSTVFELQNISRQALQFVFPSK
jgi:hypothetical protein